LGTHESPALARKAAFSLQHHRCMPVRSQSSGISNVPKATQPLCPAARNRELRRFSASIAVLGSRPALTVQNCDVPSANRCGE
jgi:hypothetical protein